MSDRRRDWSNNLSTAGASEHCDSHYGRANKKRVLLLETIICNLPLTSDEIAARPRKLCLLYLTSVENTGSVSMFSDNTNKNSPLPHSQKSRSQGAP